jgi:hypothetical protein
VGLARYDGRSLSHLGRLHIRVAGCYSCRLRRRQRRTRCSPPHTWAPVEPWLMYPRARQARVQSLVESGCTDRPPPRFSPPCRPLFQARGRQVPSASGATMPSVRHTAAKHARRTESIEPLHCLCLIWPQHQICLLLEYALWRRYHAARLAGSMPAPDVSRVNIALITLDYQAPCTTSSMRCVTTSTTS